MENSRPSIQRSASVAATALVAGLLASGCPTPPVEPLAGLTLPPPNVAPDGTLTVGDEDHDAHFYAFLAAADGSPERRAEREALILYELREAQRSMQEQDALDVRAALDRVLILFDPDELDSGLDSPALRKLLAWIAPVALRLGRPEDSLVIAEAGALVNPDDTAAEQTAEEIIEWAAAADDEEESLERQADLLDAVTEILPAPGLVKRLVGVIFRRHDMGNEPSAIASIEDWLISARREQYYFSGLTLNVLRLSVRLGRPEAAIDMLEPYRGTAEYLSEVLDEVAALLDPVRRADAAADLAEALGPQFPQETRRLCLAFRREFRDDGRFSACLSQYYAVTDQYGIAARLMLEATSRDPGRQEFANQAMALLGAEIQQGIDGMPWAQLQGLYDAFVAVLDRFHAAWPVAEPPLEQSDVLNLLANAALIGGDVAKARQLHQQALDLQPSAQAYLEFGQMEARAGDPTRARELLQAGLAVGTGNLADRTLAQANIHEELGLLEAAQGNQQVANEAFDEAIDDWKQLGRAGALPEAQVDAKIGVLQVRGGQREQGLQRIALAVREAGEDEFGPDEDSVVYNDTLSFLHMQGERELLTELFAQAATRQDLLVEWRVYYALWTLGASRRDGLPDDPETLAFLDAIRATDWSGVLARFYRGELTFDAALASADTLGQQTELRYYEALNRIDAGDREGARALLQQVIDTHIFNYFEWEMARHTMAGLDAASPAAATDAQPADVSVSR